MSLLPAALVFDTLVQGEGSVAALSAELRQHYDRHGLSPKAMLQLRWRLVEGGEPAGSPMLRPGRSGSARRRRLARSLELVEGGS